MPPSSRSTSNANSNSNLHTSVTFTSPAIYAGEEIECIITFRNVARPKREKTEGKERGAGNDGLRSGTSTRTHSRMPSVAASRVSSRGGVVARGGHNKSASLNVVVSGSSQAGTHSRTASVTPMGPPPLPGTNAARSGKPAGGHAHGRSLSIISMNSEGRLPIHTSKSTSLLQSPTQQRPGRSHTRSASLQYPPSRSPTNQGLQPAPRNPSPLYEATTPPALAETSQSIRPNRRRPGTMSAGNTPQIGTRPAAGGRKVSNGGGEGMNSFRFPADSTNPTAISETESRPKPVRTPSTMHSGQNRSYSPPWAGGVPQSAMNPLTRVMSAYSQDGTPRTSSEFYSMSNHSDETLFSEIATPQNYHGQQQQGRLLPKNTATHSQQLSRSLSTRKTFSSEPQTLMMAYVQTMGHFTLDGSLVNTAPFEEVKRKGVQGGGGVVGVERSKRSSGLFGALSWGNIGESLGGLLGGDEMSSMAQMKASIGSKTIPLLSTPQSLLFVDLRLAPGESKSFSYRFVLPRGLPPTHKGRAMKVSYFLSLGVQRPEGQQVKTLEIPFRMLGSYDSRGDTLGHDLMSPYVLLRDAARTQALKPDAVTPSGRPTPEAQRKLKAAATKKSRSPQQGLEDFLRYTERLLDTPSDIHGALLSPTSPSSNSGISSSFPPLSRQSSPADATPSTIREAIDLAILRSNFATTTSSPSPSSSPASSSERQPTTPAAAANRFNISRNTHPVAVLTLLRPAYRLGESVLGTLDFTALPSAQTCYAINLTLESSEIIDSSLALRSPASVLRATRKIHAAQSVNTLFSRRVAFSLAVPADVAPGFETSGVGVRWRVRVEFVVGREKVRVEEEEEGGGDDEDDGDDHELWETVGKDERGVVRIARERLGAEEFGIEVPIRVLGAVGVEAGNGEGGGFVG